jgi:hypothetical protein
MKKILLMFLVFVIIVLVGIVGLEIVALKYNSNTPVNKDLTLTPKDFSTPTTTEVVDTITPSSTNQNLPSRMALEEAEVFVKQQKLQPIEAARLYAYVSTAYSETLRDTDDSKLATLASETILRILYPTTSTQSIFTTSSILNKISSFQELVQREQTDGFHTLKTSSKIPKGEGVWKPTSNAPFFPLAGDWQRWLIPQNKIFTVPSPPSFNSTEYKEQIKLLKQVIANRTQEQENVITEWSGGIGTETLAGMWQNVLWNIFSQKNNTSVDSKKTDRLFAYMQQILAEGIADTFMETWKVKFTHWTPRPSTQIDDAEPLLSNPHSPSYISEFAATASASKEILLAFFPERLSLLNTEAENCSNARLWSGNYFAIDTEEGKKFGAQIGKEIVKHIGIFE